MSGEWFDPRKNTANNEDEHVTSKVTKEVHSIVKLLDSKQRIPHTKKDGKNNMDNANEEGKPQNAKEINVIKELNFGLEYMLNLRRGKC